MTDLTHLSTRVAALESIFSKVNLGDWSNDQEVPIWLAQRIRQLYLQQLGPQPEPWFTGSRANLLNTVQIAAQAKAAQGAMGETLSRLTSEIIDDWCGTRVPGRFPPRPHWGVIVEQLGVLAESYPSGSLVHETAFDLSRRVVNRAHELGRQSK